MTSATDALTRKPCGALRYASPPAFHRFLLASRKRELECLFQDIRDGDFIFFRASDVDIGGVAGRVLCLADPPLQRDVYDLSIKVYLPADDLLPSNWNVLKSFDVTKQYRSGNLFKAMVRNIDRNRQRLLITTKESEQNQTVNGLGLVKETDLPAYFRAGFKFDASRDSYRKCLEATSGWINPASVSNLCPLLGLPGKTQGSLLPSLKNVDLSSKQLASTLRKEQSERLAHRSVRRGVEKLRDGSTTEALQHFNRALQVDEDNVEALVARGALYANSESFFLSIEDLERALSLNPDHKNARDYLIHTLKNHARKLSENTLVQDDDDGDSAFERRKDMASSQHKERLHKIYSRILELDPGCKLSERWLAEHPDETTNKSSTGDSQKGDNANASGTNADTDIEIISHKRKNDYGDSKSLRERKSDREASSREKMLDKLAMKLASIEDPDLERKLHQYFASQGSKSMSKHRSVASSTSADDGGEGTSCGNISTEVIQALLDCAESCIPSTSGSGVAGSSHLSTSPKRKKLSFPSSPSRHDTTGSDISIHSSPISDNSSTSSGSGKRKETSSATSSSTETDSNSSGNSSSNSKKDARVIKRGNHRRLSETNRSYAKEEARTRHRHSHDDTKRYTSEIPGRRWSRDSCQSRTYSHGSTQNQLTGKGYNGYDYHHRYGRPARQSTASVRQSAEPVPPKPDSKKQKKQTSTSKKLKEIESFIDKLKSAKKK